MDGITCGYGDGYLWPRIRLKKIKAYRWFVAGLFTPENRVAPNYRSSTEVTSITWSMFVAGSIVAITFTFLPSNCFALS